ncbi:MAG: ribonuclease III domain-containing protein [Coleofasciculaceae cyanobacterium]
MSLNFEAIKEAISIPEFCNTDLLKIALTHPSYVYEDSRLNRQQQELQERQYRRLAILGDSIFNTAVVDYLYQYSPSLNKGEITEWKSCLVSRNKAYEFAKKINLPSLCLLGGSERNQGENKTKGTFDEMFEALVGAIYLEWESDFSRTRDWLCEHFLERAIQDLLTERSFTENPLPEDSLQKISNMDYAEAIQELKQMQQQANLLVTGDEKLQQILSWINQKSLAVEDFYKPVKVRAFYLALIRLLGLALVRNCDPSKGSAKARQFFSSFNRADNTALSLAFSANPNIDPANVLIPIFVLNLEPEVKELMQELRIELPKPQTDRESFEAWRQANGLAWLEKFKAALGHDLQFSKQQKESLKKYYEKNKLLIECLHAASNIPLEEREKIKETLFQLPT